MELRAVVFDTFGTLVDWRGSLMESLGAWGAECGVSADWAGLADAWRGEYQPSLSQVREGRGPWTDLDTLQRESLQRLAPRFGLDLDDASLDALTLHWHRLRPWPDAVQGLNRLRHRFLLAPLSNGNTALLADLARFGGLPWDTIFGADVFQHYKPDPETYLGACRLLFAPGHDVRRAQRRSRGRPLARAAHGVHPPSHRVWAAAVEGSRPRAGLGHRGRKRGRARRASGLLSFAPRT